MYAPRFAAAFVVSMLSCVPACCGEKAQPNIADERRQAFEWMTKLGYPEIKDAPFVLVATGHWTKQRHDAPSENSYQYGFLLSESGKSFKIQALGLESLTYTKTPANTPPHEHVDYEVLDLAKEASTLLAGTTPTGKEDPKPRKPLARWMGPHLCERSQLFVMAWRCSQRGLDGAAAKLYEQAKNPKYDWTAEAREKPAKSLQEKIARDLAHTEMWRGVISFGDLEKSRRELLGHFERIVANFPRSPHHANAAEFAATLKRMVQEDEDHAAIRGKGKPFDQLTRREKIAELVFQLRDQPGEQYTQPGHCDIFRLLSRRRDTPAHRLVEMGYEAVPQLLEVLEDKRHSRAVEFGRSFFFSHNVLSVGTCARTIIEEIAGVRFDKPYYSAEGDDLKGTELARAEIAAWHAELQKKGEKRFLIDAIDRGDLRSRALGERLVERHPRDALAALIRGAGAARDGDVRAGLVRLVAGFKEDASLQFLLDEMKNGPLAPSRLQASEALHERGRPEGLSAAIAWWRINIDPSTSDKVHDMKPEAWSYRVGEFLAHAGEVSAIRALADNLRKRDVKLRLEIVETLGLKRSYYRAVKEPKEPAKIDAAVEDLLVASFDDRESCPGVNKFLDGKLHVEPRVCDMAGYSLQQLHPKRYEFDMSAPLEVRNRQLVVMLNVRRVARMTAPSP